ncbi:MAG: hypothetical protein IPF52_08920 [Saprospiraceae bacterium]|nr:hypothetical protein [Saprospiraceae bacterium]
MTVTDTNACRGSDDFTLTILPLPDITISGKDTICVGECTTLTASGGLPISGMFLPTQIVTEVTSSVVNKITARSPCTGLLPLVPFNSSVPPIPPDLTVTAFTARITIQDYSEWSEKVTLSPLP